MSASGERVRIGVVGLGRMGARHARNLATRIPAADLVAAMSPSAEERAWAERTLGVRHLYDDYGKLLAHRGLEAVCLVSPTSEHANQIIEALAAGKHVFSEKPTSLNLEDCLRVEAAAAKHPSQRVLIGYVRRFDASYRDAFAKVSAGAIGVPFLVRSHTLDKNDPTGYFVRYAPRSGGIFLDMSVHDIDAARWFLKAPKPLRVFATGTIAVHQGLKDCGDLDNGMALLEFEGGRIACIQASRTMAHGHESMSEIVGTGGRITIGANPRLTRVEIADAQGVRNEATPTYYERFEDAFVAELSGFVEAIRGGTALPLTLRDATEATRIGIAIQESIRTRKSVEIEKAFA